MLAAAGALGGCRSRAAQPKLAPAPAESARQPAPTGQTAERWGEAAGLRYLEVVLDAADSEQPLPMVVIFHGRGDSAHREWIEGWQLRARFVFPQAPLPFSGGYSWFTYVVGESDDAEVARGMQPAVEQVAKAIAELVKTRPTRGKPIAAGFSQGGHLCFALALRHPETIAFSLPVAGSLPAPLWPSAPQPGVRYPPIRALHGDRDRTVPFDYTENMVRTLSRAGFDIELRRFPGEAHSIPPDMRQAMFELVKNAL